MLTLWDTVELLKAYRMSIDLFTSAFSVLSNVFLPSVGYMSNRMKSDLIYPAAACRGKILSKLPSQWRTGKHTAQCGPPCRLLYFSISKEEINAAKWNFPLEAEEMRPEGGSQRSANRNLTLVPCQSRAAVVKLMQRGETADAIGMDLPWGQSCAGRNIIQ